MKRLGWLLPIVFLLAACSSAPIAVNTTPYQTLEQEARGAIQNEYRIGVGDELDIKFTYNPELNERVPVRPDGRISIPLAKQTMVVGMTTAELEQILRDRYAPDLKKPDVTVIVRGFNGQKIFVDGEVGRPGLWPFMGTLTVWQAITQAGGLRDTARTHEILVIRRTKEKPLVTVLNMEKARDNSDMSNDIMLMPYDIVYVPKSKIGNVDTWVDLYIRRLIPFPIPQVIPTPAYIVNQGSYSTVY